MPGRRALKMIVFALCLIGVSPLVLLAWLEKKILDTDIFFDLGAQILSLVPGLPGYYFRGAYYFGTLDDCSWETHIGFGTLFTHRSAVVRRNFSTGSYCVFGHVAIGEAVRVASRVSVPSGKRQHLDDEGRLDGGVSYETVGIGPGCWIGEGAIVMADVGANSIVSAGAVVLSDVPDSVIAGGNPAKVIKAVLTAGNESGD